MKYQYEEPVRLNPEPTPAQRLTYRRHQKAGTSPGNPKWYRPTNAVTPFKFVPGRPAHVPKIETGAQWNTWRNKNSVRKGGTITTKYADGSEVTRRY